MLTTSFIKRRIGIGSSALPLAIFAAISQSFAYAGPRLNVDKAIHDFGAVRVTTESQSVEHVYKLSNSGDENLIIESVKPGCGCTTANLSKNVLAPGESVDLATSLSLKGRRGPLTKSILVTSNDASSPSMRLELKLDAQRDVDIAPAYVNFRIDPKRPSTTESTVVINFNGAKDYHITSMDTNGVPFCLIESQVVRDGKEVHIKIKLRTDVTELQPKQTAQLVVHTDHPDYATLEIPVSYYVYSEPVRPPISIYPQTLNVPKNYDSGKTFKQALLVRSNQNTPLTVHEISSPSEYISISTQSMNKAYIRYEVSFIKMDPGMNGEKVVIRATAQGQKEQTFSVPIHLR